MPGIDSLEQAHRLADEWAPGHAEDIAQYVIASLCRPRIDLGLVRVRTQVVRSGHRGRRRSAKREVSLRIAFPCAYDDYRSAHSASYAYNSGRTSHLPRASARRSAGQVQSHLAPQR